MVLPRLLAILLLGLLACQTPLERGERLYRQGDLPGALAVWDEVGEGKSQHVEVTARREEVSRELDRLLRRYEKRGAFHESEGKLAEAILYYRLRLKIADRPETLALVQKLVRDLERRQTEERNALASALNEGKLRVAAVHAANLERLNPFDPQIQLDSRGVQAAAGSEVQRHLAAGEAALYGGDRKTARAEFEQVLGLEEDNKRATGFLSTMRRDARLAARNKPVPPPASISQDEIVAEGNFRIAQQAEDRGQPYSAIAEYLAALRANPRHVGARRGLANLRRDLAPRVDELYATGQKYFLDEDLHNALRVWRRLLLVEPNHTQALENVQRAERILRRLEEIQGGGTGD